MQLSFRFKEQLFHELAELTQSGVPFAKALTVMARDRSQPLGRWASKAVREWERNRSVQRAMLSSGLAERDAAVVEAGESSGRLAEVFSELSAYYHQLAKAKQALVTRSLYPLFIFHFGILIMSIPQAIMGGGLMGYLRAVIPALGLLYLAIAALLFGSSFLRRLLAASPLVAREFRYTPILGGFFRDWTGWSFAMIASLYLRTGGGLLNAFSAAGRGSGNAAISSGTRRAVENVRSGSGLADAFAHEDVLPAELQRAIEIGEHSGKIDGEMTRAAERFQQKSLQKLDLAAEWLPRLLYVGIVLFTGWQVIEMAMGIGDSFSKVLDVGTE